MEISRKAVATEISFARAKSWRSQLPELARSCEFNHEIKISPQETWLSHGLAVMSLIYVRSPASRKEVNYKWLERFKTQLPTYFAI